MNQDTDPPPTGPSWRQVFVQFDDYAAAEHTGVAHLHPVMTDAEDAGLVTSWWFVRKAPCWRLRYLPTHHGEQNAHAFLHQSLDTLRATGHIAGWVETIYEPEVHAFGGTAAMDIAHRLFHADSRHIFEYLVLFGDGPGEPTGRSTRRELSVLLCAALMRAAGQDRYEQGDIWAKVADHRPTENSAQPEQWRAFTAAMKRLITVDTGLGTALRAGALKHASHWLAAFEQAGHTLKTLSGEGLLTRGIRAVTAHHIIFHWNRLGLPYQTQANMALAAKEAIFEDRRVCVDM